jgi:hypothetical protein
MSGEDGKNVRSSVGQKESLKEEIENEGLRFRAFSVGHRSDAVSAVGKQ